MYEAGYMRMLYTNFAGDVKHSEIQNKKNYIIFSTNKFLLGKLCFVASIQF